MAKDAYASAQDALQIWQDIVENTSVEDLEKELGPDIIEIKNTAYEFLNYMIDKQKGYLVVQEHIKAVKRLRTAAKKADMAYEDMSGYIEANAKMHELFEQNGYGIYQHVIDFQDKLNKLLNQKVQMLYVYEGSDGTPFIYEVSEEDLLQTLKYDYTRTAMTARINFTQDRLQAMKEITQKSNYKNIGNIQNTYKEIMARYRRAKTAKNNYIYYEHPPGQYHKLTISTEGDVNEAYAAIVLNRQIEEKFNTTDVEKNISEFAPYIVDVDNISGLLQGDITDGDVEYAIKSAQAGMLGVSQMINMAKRILNNTKFNKQTLKNEKAKLAAKGKTRNVDTIVTKLNTEIEEALRPIEESGDKN